MKQFFKFVFATITGLILFSLLFIGLLVGIAAAAGGEKEAKVEANSILKLDLNYKIPEQTSEANPLASLGSGDFGPKKAIGLTQIREVIKKAKSDDNIKGIYLEL